MEHFPGRTLSESRAQSYLSTGTWSEDTFLCVMERNVERFGQLCHRDDTRTLSYSELWEESESVAAHLYQIGVRKGDKVAIQLPTSLDFVVALFGITRLGAVAVLLQADLGRNSVAESLQQSRASVLIAAYSYKGLHLVDTAMSLAEELPGLHTIVEVGAAAGSRSTEALSPTRVRVVAFEDWRDSQATLSNQAKVDNRPTALDPFVMVFTAGTTGSPKGIVHLHANTLWSARTYAGLYQMGEASAMLCLAPVYHLTGFLVGITMPVATGSRMLLLDRFAAARAIQWITHDKPNYIVGAPPHLIHIAKEPVLQTTDVSSVKLFFYAGAPAPSAVLQQLQADTGWVVGGLFGWSEGFLATATRPDDPIEAINQTVGWAIPGVEVKLVDDEGLPVPQGHIGEVWGRGPSFSAGYYHQPEAAREKWDDDGWFHSGDLMRQDDAGRFVYKGRSDSIINRGGTKIDPREVEAACAKHPAIQTVAVIGVPDAKLGYRTAAAVVLKPNANPFTQDELRAFLMDLGLAKYQLPDKLAFFEQPSDVDGSAFGSKELAELAKVSLASGADIKPAPTGEESK